jgi:hypothetical protein
MECRPKPKPRHHQLRDHNERASGFLSVRTRTLPGICQAPSDPLSDERLIHKAAQLAADGVSIARRKLCKRHDKDVLLRLRWDENRIEPHQSWDGSSGSSTGKGAG